jgi:hypothetical protein
LADAPDFTPAVLLLGARARAAGDVRSADRLYRDAIRRRPRGVLLERLASLHAGTPHAEQALATVRDACAGNHLAAPRLALARMLVACGKLEAAESELADLSRANAHLLASGVDVSPERDVISGELALARGHDHEAATLFARAAGGHHKPFAYACERCGRTSTEWLDECACGAYASFDWLVSCGGVSAQSPRETARREQVIDGGTPADSRLAPSR